MGGRVGDVNQSVLVKMMLDNGIRVFGSMARKEKEKDLDFSETPINCSVPIKNI